MTNLCNDLSTLALLNGCLGALMVLNIVLGAIMASAGAMFDKQKFFKGVLKALLVCLVMICFCAILEVLPVILARVGFAIPNEIPTYIEIISIVVVSVVKYAKGIVEKLKTLLEVTDEEVTEYINPHTKDGVEHGEG